MNFWVLESQNFSAGRKLLDQMVLKFIWAFLFAVSEMWSSSATEGTVKSYSFQENVRNRSSLC